MLYEVESYLSDLHSNAEYKTVMFIGDNFRENWFKDIAQNVQSLSPELVVKYENDLWQMFEDLKKQKLELIVADPYYNLSKFSVYNWCVNGSIKLGIKPPPFIFMSSRLTPQTAVDAVLKAKAQDVIIYQEINDMQLIARRIIFNGLVMPSMQ